MQRRLIGGLALSVIVSAGLIAGWHQIATAEAGAHQHKQQGMGNRLDHLAKAHPELAARIAALRASMDAMTPAQKAKMAANNKAEMQGLTQEQRQAKHKAMEADPVQALTQLENQVAKAKAG